ncbi:hypothetical protein Q7P37_005675 [Cladosporium fusiforme]
MMLPVLAAACLLLKSASAVFVDEAWNIDYHHALLGKPQESTTFFHRPNPASRASLIYTLSERGVLGAVNPRDGSLVWRQFLEAEASSDSSFLRAGEDQDLVISGVGNQVASWSAGDGRLAWSHTAPGLLQDLEILELSDGKETPGAKDALVLAGGEHAEVQRLDGATGSVKWSHKLESGDEPYQVSASSTEVFAILLQKTMLGYIKIKVITLDPVTGKKTDEYTLNSDSELASADTIVSVGANSASPIIAWADAAYSTLKINIIGTKAVSSFNIEKHNEHAVQRITLQAPYHTNSLAHFLVEFETAVSDWAEVYHIDLKKSQIEKAYSLPKITGRSAFSTSSSDANVYFTRITNGEVSTVSSASHGVLGRWKINDFGIAVGREEAAPVHAVSEVSIKGDSVSAVRSAVYLASGEWVLLRDGSASWQRLEVLADTISAAFAIPFEAEALVHELEEEAHSTPVHAYVHRIKRHINDLKSLPETIRTLPQSFMRGFLGTSDDHGDAFGFNQIITCATSSGRLLALDGGNPNSIIWSKQVVQVPAGQSWAARVEALPNGIIRVAQDNNAEAPLFNASTGEKISSSSEAVHIDSPLPVVAVEYTLTDNELVATAPGPKEAGNLWHFVPQPGEKIVSLVSRPTNDPVASIGKVLGDRNVLYKYLNPNLALLVTAHEAAKSASVYVLDTVSGAIIYSNTHKNVDLSAPIASTLSENWFAYSFTAESSDFSPKGHQLVSGELFESLSANDRGLLDDAANVSSLAGSTEPFTLTQTYQIPESIAKLSVTQTRQGITSRQLLAVLADSSSIVGIPRGVIDPRRPVGRDATKNEQMEGLVKYAPVIEFDPKWHLNHAREVIGVKDIVTSPAVLESTSLIFAYGLDVFGTRLTPSFSFDRLGKDFNKFQMLATVAALAVVTFIVTPLVKRKQVNARWQFALTGDVRRKPSTGSIWRIDHATLTSTACALEIPQLEESDTRAG